MSIKHNTYSCYCQPGFIYSYRCMSLKKYPKALSTKSFIHPCIHLFVHSFIHSFIHLQCLILLKIVVDQEPGNTGQDWRVHLVWDTSSSHGTMHIQSLIIMGNLTGTILLPVCAGGNQTTWRTNTLIHEEHVKICTVIQAKDQTGTLGL